MGQRAIEKVFWYITMFGILFMCLGCSTFPNPDTSTNSHLEIPTCLYGDCKNGFGIKGYPNSHYSRWLFVGEWKDGKRNGKGTLKNDYLSSSSHGIWRDDKFIDGTVDSKYGQYKISYINNEIAGEYISYQSKDKYQGTFSYYEEHYPDSSYLYPYMLKPLYGQITWENGDRYYGTFGCIEQSCGYASGQCGYPDGKGVFISADGSRFESDNISLPGLCVPGTESKKDDSKQTLEIYIVDYYEPMFSYKLRIKERKK